MELQPGMSLRTRTCCLASAPATVDVALLTPAVDVHPVRRQPFYASTGSKGKGGSSGASGHKPGKK